MPAPAIAEARKNARTFLNASPPRTALANPDTELIHELGSVEVARLFGVEPYTMAFWRACGEYANAFTEELSRLATK